jgi:hypothetical protein
MREKRRPQIPKLKGGDKIPLRDYAGYPFVAQNAYRSGIKKEKPPTYGGKTDPPCREHPQDVSVREKRHVSVDFRSPRNRPVRPRRDLLDGLTAGNRAIPNQPTRRMFSNVGSGDAFVDAVIPFLEIIVDLGNAAISGQPRRFTRPQARTGEYQGELLSG